MSSMFGSSLLPFLSGVGPVQGEGIEVSEVILNEYAAFKADDPLALLRDEIARLEVSGFDDALDDVIDAVLAADSVVFLYFYAEWCHYCQQERPIVDVLTAAYADQIVVIRVDGERNPTAMTAFDVAGYPSMFLISGSDGTTYASQAFRGFTTEAVLAEAFDAVVDVSLAQPGWDLEDEYFAHQVERSSSFNGVDAAPDELGEAHTCDAYLCETTCTDATIFAVWGSSGYPSNPTPTDAQTFSDIIMGCIDICYNTSPRFWSTLYGHECRDGVAADVRRPFCAGRYGLWVEDCNNCEKNYVYIPCGSGKECQYSASAGRAICVSTSQPSCDDDDDCTNDYGSYPNCWYTRIPGCDNPDDNVAISALTSATPPPGDALTVPTAGVLFHGFALEVLDLLDALGYAGVPVNLSLEGLDAFPVLVIPSGGLAGLDASPTFAAGLAAYVADGGTLLVFSQQHGDEYAALPGGALTGYGWLEDQSCQFASVAIDAYHPIHAGQTRSTLDLNVDGFFTGYPENSTVLLRRTKNGMPAMLLYEHGQGRVVAATLYSDMAASLYQDTADEETLIRDLVAWAATGASMPSYPRGPVTITLNVTNPYDYPAHVYSPGDLVTLQVNVTNRGDVASNTVTFVLSDPYHDAYTTVTQSVAATIPPNASALLEFTFKTTESSPPGIWSITYFLYAGDDLVHAERGAQFALDYDVDDASAFTASAQVLGPDRTLVKQTSTSLAIPPGATGSFDVVLFAGDLGIYELVYAVESTNDATVASGRHLFAVSAFTGTPGGYARQGSSFDFLVTSEDEYYLLDDNVTLTFNLWNHDSVNHTVVVEWEDANRTVEVPAGGSTAFEDTAGAATFGTGRNRLYAYLKFANDTLIGYSVRVFNVVDSEVMPTITPDQTTYAEGDTVHLTVTLFNPTPKSDSTTAVVTVEHQDQVLFTQNFTRNIDALASALVTTNYSLPVDAFGPFYAHVAAYPTEGCASENDDACLLGRDGTFFEVPSIVSSLHLDQPEYRARDAVAAELQLFNNMHDAWDQTVTVAVPALGLSDSSSVHLDLGSDQAATFVVTLPADLPPGPYDVTVTFVEEGETVQYADAFYVPPSLLRFHGVTVSTGALGLRIGNTGGVDTTYNVTYALMDLLAPSTAIAPTERSGTIQAGETTVLTVPLPLGLVGQTYYLVLTLTDETTEASTDATVPVFIDGVSVSLVSETDRTVYTTDDLVAVLTNIAVTEAITDATLHLEILAGQPLPPKGCVVPMDDLLVTEDVVLCPGTYAINDTNRDGVIRIYADNVVIEGNGTVLVGSGTTAAGWGIANDGYDNVVVRNLELEGYERSISFRNSEYHRIENVTIVMPTYAYTCYYTNPCGGIYLNNVHRSDIVGNNVSTNIQHGLYAVASTLNVIAGNTFFTTSSGIYLETQSNTNTITSNRVTGGPYSYTTWYSRTGLFVHDSSNNTIAENDFSYLYMGINLYESDNNTVMNNDVSGSTTQWQSGYTGYIGGSGYGMQLNTAHNNAITDNNASSHGTGFILYGSDGNVFTNNLVKFNSYHDNYNRYYGKGVDLDNSDGNVFLNNNVSENYYGLYLTNSENNTFRDTELTSNSYSFEVNTARYTTRGFDNDVDPSNLVNGQPIYYLLDAQDVVLDAVSNPGVVYCIRCENLTVRDLDLSHSGAGIYLYETVNAQLLNNTLANNQYGIYLRASTAVVMQDNAIAVTGLDPQAGIELYDASSNEIVANTLTGIQRMYGVNLDESDDLVIADNEFTGQGLAIYLHRSESILIEGNTISNGGAIYFRADSIAEVSINNTIRHNEVYGITGYGLTAKYLYDSLIAHNNFTDSRAGIDLSLSNNVVVIGNNASYNGWPSSTGYGILVESSENIQLLNNTANTNYNTGIFLARVRNCSISGNNVTDNRSQGIRLWSSHNNTITDNVVHDNGYLTYNGEGIYLGNNYYQPYGSHNNTIANNSVRYNHRYGIWLEHSSANNTLFDNLICANTQYDVFNASSLNVGYSNTCNTTSNWNDIGATGCTFTCPANGNGGSPAPPMTFCPSCDPTLSPTEPLSSSSHAVAEMPPIAPSSPNDSLLYIKAPIEPLVAVSSVAYAPSDGGTLPDHVIWDRVLSVSVADVAELTTAVGALNVTGKLFLAATLRSSIGRVLAYSLFPFFVTDQDVALTMTTDQRLYTPGDLVTITGTVENLGSAGAFSFQLQANGSTFYADTVSLDVGATHD
jgi:parallel beta-helix repeat protein